MVFMYLGLDDVQVLIEAAFALMLSPDVNGHLQPPVQAVRVILQVQDAGQLDQLLPLHDV